MQSGALHAPVRYSPDVEDVKPDEGQTIDGLNETFDTILKTVADDSGHAVRSVHAEAHDILEGMLRIDPNLPLELAQGFFDDNSHKDHELDADGVLPAVRLSSG